jgi:hypothetical protein
MDSTSVLHASSRTSFGLAGAILLAGLAACGGMAERTGGESLDAPVVPTWPADVTYKSCDQYAGVSVGSYYIQSNYWNLDNCPGKQCIEVNTSTGAFSVTEGGAPCQGKETVSSFPYVLYGCSYGNCSPGSVLPMQVSKVSSLISSWDFEAGGTSTSDGWNVALELWFCPDNTCGADGFPNGFELMLWLDYSNAHGWKDHLGTVSLAGYSWDVWLGQMAAGGKTVGWGYTNYIIQPKMVQSVTNLDLYAFIKDAVTRGFIQNSWYLYGIQAGIEVRKGGIPFNSKSFSVAVNGVTPSLAPPPDAGLACAAEAPTADGQLTISDTYVTAGPLHGYGVAWTAVDVGSDASACAMPVCTAGQEGGAGTCSPAFGSSALCIAGAVSADTTYHATAGLGFMLNQDLLVGGGAEEIDGGVDSGAISPIGTITVPKSITVTVAKSGTNLAGNNSLRVQMTDVNGNLFCYGGDTDAPIPISDFNTKCWNNSGDAATPSTAFTRLDVIVPSSSSSERDFSYCITNVTVQ